MTTRIIDHVLCAVSACVHCCERYTNMRAIGICQGMLAAALAVLCLNFTLNAQEPFRDNFDGPTDDGDPVTWTPHGFVWPDFPGGPRRVEDGNWVWELPAPDMHMSWGVEEHTDFEDVSVHAQFRMSNVNSSINMAICNGLFYMRMHEDGTISGDYFPTEDFYFWRDGTGLDPVNNDVHMQFDKIHDELSVTVWHDGDPKPAIPNRTVDIKGNPDATCSGRVGLGLNRWDDVTATAEFRFFEANPLDDLQPGDFDASGELDLADIIRLSAEINSGDANVHYDLTDDELVTVEDLGVWVKDLKSTWIGDANLDGEFNSSDLVTIFQAGKFELDENAGWQEGDWNADRRFGSGDLVAAFQDGGYEMGLRAATVVPEPTVAALWVLACLAIVLRMRSIRD